MTRTASLIIRNVAFTVVVPGLGGGLAPWWIGSRDAGPGTGTGGTPLTWAGIVATAAGAALYLWCLWLFATAGDGTPGPWDAPRQFVATGPYRWVRNPIYIAALLVVLGQAGLFRSVPLVEYAAAMAVGCHLFVVCYEEPALSRRFGDTYVAYRRAVHRWVPVPPRRAA